MNTDFPVIKNIYDCLPAIQGRNEFIVHNDEKLGLTFINYKITKSDTFPPIKNKNDAIRREMRGIAFYNDDGSIASRPFHKFFNLNEREETLYENIKWEDYTIFNKIDGSYVRPIMLRNGNIIFTTKAGFTNIAERANHYAKDKGNILQFSKEIISSGQTPIFEFVSPFNRVVIDYNKKTFMKLLAIRNNTTGEYMKWNEVKERCKKYHIETVDIFHFKLSSQEFVTHTYNLKGEEEGYVVVFNEQQRLKIKGAEYCRIHKTIEGIQLEKNILNCILNDDLDDLLPFLETSLRDKINKFNDSFVSGITKSTEDLSLFALSIYKKSENIKKDYVKIISVEEERKKIDSFPASLINIQDKKYKPLIIPLFDSINNIIKSGNDINDNKKIMSLITPITKEKILVFIKNNLGSQNKINDCRFLSYIDTENPVL